MSNSSKSVRNVDISSDVILEREDTPYDNIILGDFPRYRSIASRRLLSANRKEGKHESVGFFTNLLVSLTSCINLFSYNQMVNGGTECSNYEFAPTTAKRSLKHIWSVTGTAESSDIVLSASQTLAAFIEFSKRMEMKVNLVPELIDDVFRFAYAQPADIDLFTLLNGKPPNELLVKIRHVESKLIQDSLSDFAYIFEKLTLNQTIYGIIDKGRSLGIGVKRRGSYIDSYIFDPCPIDDGIPMIKGYKTLEGFLTEVEDIYTKDPAHCSEDPYRVVLYTTKVCYTSPDLSIVDKADLPLIKDGWFYSQEARKTDPKLYCRKVFREYLNVTRSTTPNKKDLISLGGNFIGNTPKDGIPMSESE